MYEKNNPHLPKGTFAVTCGGYDDMPPTYAELTSAYGDSYAATIWDHYIFHLKKMDEYYKFRDGIPSAYNPGDYDDEGYDADGYNLQGFNRNGYDKFNNHMLMYKQSSETSVKISSIEYELTKYPTTAPVTYVKKSNDDAAVTCKECTLFDMYLEYITNELNYRKKLASGNAADANQFTNNGRNELGFDKYGYDKYNKHFTYYAKDKLKIDYIQELKIALNKRLKKDIYSPLDGKKSKDLDEYDEEQTNNLFTTLIHFTPLGVVTAPVSIVATASRMLLGNRNYNKIREGLTLGTALLNASIFGFLNPPAGPMMQIGLLIVFTIIFALLGQGYKSIFQALALQFIISAMVYYYGIKWISHYILNT